MCRIGLGLGAAVLLCGCRAVTTSYDYPEDLRHPDYVKRTKAAREFAARLDAEQLPAAFALLVDEEAQIRALAYETIKRLSPGGEDRGYRPYLPADVRAATAARWRAWWVKSREGGGDGG